MIHQRPVDVEVAFTKDWWVATLANPEKLKRWLQKLQQTEIGGYDDYMAFLRLYKTNQRTSAIFTNIAEDEKKHSGLIVDVLKDRGWDVSEDAMPSTYWDTMNTLICDVKTAACVNYFGEALAAFRFEIIAEHPGTPGDIRRLLQVVLPDEQFHRQTLKRIAGDDLIEQFAEYHFTAVNKIKTTKENYETN